MATYNCVFNLSFAVGGLTKPNGDDVTPAQARASILYRLQSLSDDELLEAIGPSDDSYQESEA